ncbi:MAG: deoxynucleoside kinase [Bacteroidota bacterium]
MPANSWLYGTAPPPLLQAYSYAMPIFVALEGFDGSGKSTVAEYLETEADFTRHRTPGGVFDQLHNRLSEYETSVRERFAFYIGSLVACSDKVRRDLESGRNVVVERYYYSTIAYHEARMPGISSNWLGLFEQLVQPDLVIYLEADITSIGHRLETRGRSSSEDIYFPLYESVIEEYGRLVNKKNWLSVINNDIKSTFSAVDTAIRKTQKRLSRTVA